jgi:YggT family protein
MLAYPLITLVHTLAQLYVLVILLRVIASWIPPRRAGLWMSICNLTYALTEPFLRPIRRALSRYTGSLRLDLSPLLLLILVWIVEDLLARLLWRLF